MARLFSFLELSSWGESMALPGNDEAIRDQRRERVARLYVAGKSQRAIALIVGVSQPTISNDLEEVRKQWLSDAKMNFAERQAKELAKIDAVEAEAWEAWDRSKAEETGEPIPAFEGEPGEEPQAGGKKIRARFQDFPGRERFLALVLRCVETRCKMLGLNAPDALNLTGEVRKILALDPRNMTDEELELAEAIARRRQSEADNPIPDRRSDSSGENAAEF
jgi:hypothetical protein